MAIRKQCHIVVLTGGKGGVGKSTLTANLALATQRECKVPVLLVDLDQKSCGDQSVILGLRSKYNVQQMSQHKGVLNEQTLKESFRLPSHGIKLLKRRVQPRTEALM